MRVPLGWLREYVDFDLSAEELAELFSLHSQEVEGIDQLGVLDGEVVVGEVVEFGPHPNADRLFVAKVDLGREEVQIVAGASNPHPGARVPVVLPGSTLAGVGKIKKARLRGLESYGMMMSERELGVSGDHEGILLLDGDFEVGRPLSDYFAIGETVLDIDVMPNRPDLWGMIGVARELSAILRTGFRVPESTFEEDGAKTAEYTLRVEEPDLCPRYDLRRVSSLTQGRAPVWMRRRIHAAGMRPVNGIVDVTNYVMLETGQPIHAFDSSKVRGGIVVRRARPGEKLTLLDGSTRTLNADTLVIADEERPLVVAGVMGAEDAEVDEGTSDVLVEVATFDGRSILETSSRLGLRTDASGRFERGLDPNMVDYTMERVCGLLSRLHGGRVAPDVLEHYPEPVEPWRVPLRLERAALLLGTDIDGEEAREVLEGLGCEVSKEQEGAFSVTVPTFRRDLRREVDLIEEIGRIVGLEKVPEEVPSTNLPGGLSVPQRRLRTLRRLLADLGLAETITYPFGPDLWEEVLSLEGDPVRVENPLSSGGRNLRRSLLPGLLEAAARNRSFGERGGALFEIGRTFEPRRMQDRQAALRFRFTGRSSGEVDETTLTGVVERPRLGVLLFGSFRPQGWNVPERRAGYFEVRGIAERIVPGAGFDPPGEGEVPAFLHPGRSARVLKEGREVGWAGELHPETAERFDLEGVPVAFLEVELSACDPDPEPHFEPFVNVPTVARDLAVVVGRDVRVGDMLHEIERLRVPILAGLRIFDVYEGEQVPEGKKSVAFGFTFQGPQTLTDEEVNAEIERIASRLGERFGAEIRGG
ncbi:MAG: phenylalanine--tRNA ligase subunit beta [Rubrobacteraceae bacterium]|nr:phenylalanine--tRNA ligase subunit beta [Rubrobacteraceae bacterium]